MVHEFKTSSVVFSEILVDLNGSKIQQRVIMESNGSGVLYLNAIAMFLLGCQINKVHLHTNTLNTLRFILHTKYATFHLKKAPGRCSLNKQSYEPHHLFPAFQRKVNEVPSESLSCKIQLIIFVCVCMPSSDRLNFHSPAKFWQISGVC